MLRGYVDVAQTNLVAIIDGRRATQSQQEHRGKPRLGSADPRGDARTIMIAEDPVRPAAGRQNRLVFVD